MKRICLSIVALLLCSPAYNSVTTEPRYYVLIEFEDKRTYEEIVFESDMLRMVNDVTRFDYLISIYVRRE